MTEGFTAYAQFVAEQLTAQEDRKKSIEQRGLAVVTTSGALAALISGVIPGYQAAGRYDLTLQIGAILVAFAAVLGLSTNLPLVYKVARGSDLKLLVDRHWQDSEIDATRRMTSTRIALFQAAQKTNRLKVRALSLGILLEVLAITMLALSASF